MKPAFFLIPLLLISVLGVVATAQEQTYHVKIRWYQEFGTYMVDHVVCRLDNNKLLVLHGAVGNLGWTTPRFAFVQAHQGRGLVIEGVLLDLSNYTRRSDYPPRGWVTEFNMTIKGTQIEIGNTVFNCVTQPDFNLSDKYARLTLTPPQPEPSTNTSSGSEAQLSLLSIDTNTEMIAAAIGITLAVIVFVIAMTRG